MRNTDIINMLGNIELLLSREEYQQAIDYIQRRKAEIKPDTDLSSQYIDDLMKNMK